MAELTQGNKGSSGSLARNLALAAGSLLAAALAGAAGFFVHWLLTPPPPEVCPLPAIGVPRAGDLLAWSPDGKRLLAVNRLGEAAVVRFPDLSVEELPPFPQTPWGAAWDGGGRPLLIYRVGHPVSSVARLREDGSGWERLPVRGIEPAVSPDGRRLAFIEAGREGNAESLLRVIDLATLRALAAAPVPRSDFYQAFWTDDRTLTVNGPLSMGNQSLEFRPGEGAPRRVARRGYPAPPLRLAYEPRKLPGEEIRQKLREWKVPGAPSWRNTDWSLSVTEPQGREVQRIPLGRRPDAAGTRGRYHTWKKAAPSPDYRLIVVRAADDTLRLLELAP
jgi:hypothetical protein